MHTAYQQTVKQAPELLKLPQVEYWVGLALLGEQTIMAKQAATAAKTSAQKKVSSAKVTAKTPTPVNPISSPKTSTKSVSAKTREKMLASGRLDDVADFMSEALFG